MAEEGTKTKSIKGVYLDGDDTKRYISVAHADIVDCLSEDGIEGLVYQDYDFTSGGGQNSQAGDLGFAGYSVKEFVPNYPESGKLCSIYWNEVPIMDQQSKRFNFSDIDVETNQARINARGFKNKKAKSINVEIKGGSDINNKFYRIYNKECSKVTVSFKFGSLGKVDRYKGTRREPNDNYGELKDSSVSLGIWYKALYSNEHVAKFTPFDSAIIVYGNFSSPFMKDVEMNLPLGTARRNAADLNNNYGDFLGWEIKIIKNSDEPLTPDTRNQVFIESMSEEIDDTLMAPHTYLVESNFNAKYFSALPNRAFDTRLQKVKIPSNYDPISRTYQGTWDGTFSHEVNGYKYGKKPNGDEYGTRNKALHWTDNPAWCFYDLVTNGRYGLGKYVDTVNIDKWTLYKIAQYCDELVTGDDGFLEPRFTCNILISTREDAFQVLNDMASIFRAIVYYSSGHVYAVQDAFKDSVFQFNNSSVENGDFTYTTTSAKVRHTVAIIRYNDKNNFYKPAVEYIDDAEGIRRYGIKEKEISAFGCTSRSQAMRLGRWVLSTERLETETISFVTGTEGALVRPGDVFTIADSNRLSKRRGGRILDFNRASDAEFTIVLDGELESLNTGRDYQLTLSTPSFFFDPAQTDIDNSSQIQYIRNAHIQKFTISHSDVTDYSNSEGKTEIKVTANINANNFNTELDKMSWSILGSGIDDAADSMSEKLNQDQRFRAINIVEKELNKYEIAGVEYREEKYAEIDTALTYINPITFNIPDTPKNIQISNVETITPNTKRINYTIEEADDTGGLAYYAVYIKSGAAFGSGVPDSSFLTDKVYSIDSPSGSFIPSFQADYHFRVYAVNALNQYSASGGSNTSGYVETLQIGSCPTAGCPPNVTPLGVVKPIRDVVIKSLRLSDDTASNESGISDPVPGTFIQGSTTEKIDEYDGSDIRVAWETTIPGLQGVNAALSFYFRVEIRKDINGPVLKTIDNFRPVDWDLAFTTLEIPLEDIVGFTEDTDGTIDLNKLYDGTVPRGFTIKIDAHDGYGNYSSDGSNINGYDKIYIKNPAPRRADQCCVTCNEDGVETPPTPVQIMSGDLPETGGCIQGLIDINGHIKIFNTNRPIDAQSVYIIAARQHFRYRDYLDTTASNYADYAFNVIRISPIANEDPVYEVDPSFKTDDMDAAYVAIAYTDDFDEDVLNYQILNGISTTDNPAWNTDASYVVGARVLHSNKNWICIQAANASAPAPSSSSSHWKGVNAPFDIRKHLGPEATGRISYTKRVSKVTPEVMDLIGEGWKAWIKLDINGNWYGRNIRCIEDVTNLNQTGAFNQKYKGYIPFYCGSRIPLINWSGLFAGTTSRIRVGGHIAYQEVRDLFSASCLYYLRPGAYTYTNTEYPNTYTRTVKLIGGWRDPDDNASDEWESSQGDDLPKGFRRWRIWFKPAQNGTNKFAKDNYWVFGMNANNDKYFDGEDVSNMNRIPYQNLMPTWESNLLDGGAREASEVIRDAFDGDDADDEPDNGEQWMIGGSDTFFNHHPAGFVQGFGGLAKENAYFDVHMGHLIDGSYLKDACFFVMASTQDEKIPPTGGDTSEYFCPGETPPPD